MCAVCVCVFYFKLILEAVYFAQFTVAMFRKLIWFGKNVPE